MLPIINIKGWNTSMTSISHTYTYTHSGCNNIRLCLPLKSQFSFIKKNKQTAELLSGFPLSVISVILIAAIIDISCVLAQQRSRAASVRSKHLSTCSTAGT